MKNILSLSIVLFCVSCSSFLDEEVFTTVESGKYYKTEKELESALVAAYSAFQDANYYDNLIFQIADTSTDMLDSRWTNNVYDNFQRDMGHAQYRHFWQTCWEANNATNAVICSAPPIVMDDGIRDRIVGEARFLRALNYFNLVRVYGPVPLELDYITSVEDDLFPVTASMDEVYDRIVKDLEFAESHLEINDIVGNSGRVTKGAATALLAKVYLTMAGYRKNSDGSDVEKLSGSEQYYDLARQKLKLIIDGEVGTYDLFDEYADVFKNEKENGKEHIFSIHFKQGALGLGVGEGSLKQSNFTPQNYGITHTAYGTYRATREFYCEFVDEDKRKKVTFLDEFVDDNGKKQFCDFEMRKNAAGKEVLMPVPGSMDHPHVRKYIRAMRDASGGFGNSTARDGEENTIVLRYADVLLMYSEAVYYSLGSGDPDVLSSINRVRFRAGAVDDAGTNFRFLTTADVNTEAKFINAILDEREKELCFEGHGWFDYVRTNQLHLRVGNYPNKANADLALKYKFYTWPIPPIEIKKNPNLVQSPGW